jgi:predicted AAA+ superfamily ATPase
VVVSGARQVGKSTLIQRSFPSSRGWRSVLRDPVADIGGARRDPDLFLDAHPAPLIVDEVQFAPELVPAINRRVDQSGGRQTNLRPQAGQYIVTGSQQWSVLRTASESLAGRAGFVDLEGFSLAELSAEPLAWDAVDPEHTGLVADQHWLARYLADPVAFVTAPLARLPRAETLQEQLWRGFLPMANQLDLQEVPSFLQAYLRTYIERDVRLIGEVADWQQFGRFVQLAATLTAQEINASHLGREIGLTPNTSRRWLSMLAATYQWFELAPYHGSTVKRVTGKRKGHIADTGLACAVQQISSPSALAGHPQAGALFESMVFAEIRKLSATLATPPAMYHWRSHGGAEVDVVLERDGILFPIEVKLTSQPTRNDCRGLQAFRSTYPTARIAPALIISASPTLHRIGENEWVMPFDAA